MDCIQNLIGIQHCGQDSDPAPQLYVNSLPGLTLENIDALADDEQQTFIGVWDDVKLRAIEKFKILVKARINKCYRITDKEVINCLVCAQVDLFAVALWYLHGTELMIERTSTDTISRYTTVDLDKAEKLKEEYYAEFVAALNDAVDSMDPKAGDCTEDCIDCRSQVNWRFQTP